MTQSLSKSCTFLSRFCAFSIPSFQSVKPFVPKNGFAISASHVANTNTERSVSDPPVLLAFVPETLLQSDLLWVLGLGYGPASVALVTAGRFEDGHSLGLGHFVEKGKVCDVLPGRRQRDHGGELVAPQDLVGQVRGAHLAGRRGGLHGGVHDHHKLKVGQLRVCPASTWWRQIDIT